MTATFSMRRASRPLQLPKRARRTTSTSILPRILWAPRLRLFAGNFSTGDNATTTALRMSVCCAKTRCRLAKAAWWTHRPSPCAITPTNTYSGTTCTRPTPSTRSSRTLSSSARKMTLTTPSLGWASSVPLQ
ncbi:unnamed protein product, partial [Ectocarpus fasciculatus]